MKFMLTLYECQKLMWNTTLGNFFNNLVALRNLNAIDRQGNISGKIYLPFNPHFFHMVNSMSIVSEKFNITYLHECDVNISNHKLSYSISCHDDFSCLNKNLDEEKRHIITTKREVLNYDAGMLMTKERCISLLSSMGDIAEIRYIVLNTKCSNNYKTKELDDYSMVVVDFLNNKNLGFRSKVVKPLLNSELVSMGYEILRNLILSPPNSLWGISIVADAPECNKAMLNVKRPGVLRQYYGLDLECKTESIVKRVAYRSQFNIRSEGTDPYKLIVKPFPQEMVLMSRYFWKFMHTTNTH